MNNPHRFAARAALLFFVVLAVAGCGQASEPSGVPLGEAETVASRLTKLGNTVLDSIEPVKANMEQFGDAATEGAQLAGVHVESLGNAVNAIVAPAAPPAAN